MTLLGNEEPAVLKHGNERLAPVTLKGDLGRSGAGTPVRAAEQQHSS